jgi:hypothetical protein
LRSFSLDLLGTPRRDSRPAVPGVRSSPLSQPFYCVKRLRWRSANVRRCRF